VQATSSNQTNMKKTKEKASISQCVALGGNDGRPPSRQTAEFGTASHAPGYDHGPGLIALAAAKNRGQQLPAFAVPAGRKAANA